MSKSKWKILTCTKKNKNSKIDIHNDYNYNAEFLKINLPTPTKGHIFDKNRRISFFNMNYFRTYTYSAVNKFDGIVSFTLRVRFVKIKHRSFYPNSQIQ